MKRIILHGGSGKSGLTGEVFTEIQRTGQAIKNILIVPFAREEEEWELVYEKYKGDYGLSSIFKEAIIQLASPTHFSAQVRQANFVVVCGGNTKLLKTVLQGSMIQALREVQNICIYGTSAGANVFCSHYYSGDAHEFTEGFGLIPLVLATHSNELDLESVTAGMQYLEIKDRPLLVLAEGEFVQFLL